MYIYPEQKYGMKMETGEVVTLHYIEHPIFNNAIIIEIKNGEPEIVIMN